MAEATRTFHAVHRWARIAPRKARSIADLVRGLPYEEAKAVLEVHPRRAAGFLLKVLKSAMANASQNPDVDLRRLVVREARVDMGPLLGGRPRWRPRAMGRATPIFKRTSHLRIGLGESPGAARRARGERAAPPPAAEPQESADTAGE
jgi:large subunit ribosomal protein L22